MADTPKRGGPSLVGVTSVTIYTAPVGAGTYGILRTVQVTNETVGTVTFSLGIGITNADAAGKRMTTNISLGAGQNWEWTGFLPILGGATPDLVYAICNTASGISVTAGVIEGP